MLFGSYRRGDANEPDIYIGAIATVLVRYDTDLIREVTDPNTGIQAQPKYMTYPPNVGELKVYCEGVAARKERLRRYGDLPRPDFTRDALPPPEPHQGQFANVFVPNTHNRYPKLLVWAETGDFRLWKFGLSSDLRAGIWVSWDIWQSDPQRIMPRDLGAPPWDQIIHTDQDGFKHIAASPDLKKVMDQS